ncbi:MAG: enoyl-CoA hydratase-related protein [Planctomycetota bacterium]|jgi:enoyl-CoA hydratase
MSDDVVRYEVNGASGIARITINRPDKLNALNADVLSALSDAAARAAADPEAKGVIVTGAGEKGFVAGADIGELAALDAPGAQRQAERGQGVFAQLANLRKPVVAAINGWALGGGCELALACHLRAASAKARLGLPETTLGVIPGYGGTQRLARLVGTGRALDLILRAEPVKADEALAMGLVNRVFDPADLLSETEAWLGTILSRGPIALGYSIEAVLRGVEMPLDDGLRLEAGLFGLCFATKDGKEGLTAFLEKRDAAFTGE